MNRPSRKREHIRHALSSGQSGRQGLADIRFVPNSLPNISYDNTKLDTQVGPLSLSSPVIINAMTGGARETEEINRKLAIVAREKGLAMAVGSQMAALRDPRLVETYQVVRQEHPRGLVFANLGAEATVEDAKRAVEMLEADALQIHLNVMQELIMPEGDRDFRGHLANIAAIARSIDVPLIVKEVGFGMDRRTIRALCDAGADVIDVGGSGGTNFAKVENMRRTVPLGMLEDWGLTTAESLLEASVCDLGRRGLVASGGLRDGLEIAKAIALGAHAVGVAGAILRLVESAPLEKCFHFIDELHHQLRIVMTALGAEKVSDLHRMPLVITGETAEWAAARGFNLRRYALRGEPDLPYEQGITEEYFS